MVTKQVINTLYKQFSRPPKSPDELNLGLIFDYTMDNHGIFIDEDNLYIGSIEPSSPFSTIELKRIHEIVEFEKVIAIVLPSSIIFLNKENSALTRRSPLCGSASRQQLHADPDMPPLTSGQSYNRGL